MGLAGFCFELLSARPRDPVELCFAIVIRRAPLGGDTAFLFELEEHGVEGSRQTSHRYAGVELLRDRHEAHLVLLKDAHDAREIQQ